MVQIKRVALAGVSHDHKAKDFWHHAYLTNYGQGTGNLGPAIVKAVLNAGFDLTVFTRSASHSASIPALATVKQVDYANQDSLIQALKGHDAFVSNVGPTAIGDQPRYIDACISAGVSFFIPSEFGVNSGISKVRAMPPWASKTKTLEYLEKKAAEGQISYASIITGPFLDWGLKVALVFNTKDQGKTTIWDGGDVIFSATNLADIGSAVAGVLKHPEECKNREVYVQSVQTTQNELIELAKKVKPGWSTTIQQASTAEGEKQAYEALERGEDVAKVRPQFMMRALFGPPEYGSRFSNTDNDLLGIMELSPEELQELVANYV